MRRSPIHNDSIRRVPKAPSTPPGARNSPTTRHSKGVVSGPWSVEINDSAPGGRAPHQKRPHPTPDLAAPAAGRAASIASLEDGCSTEGSAAQLGACSRAAESGPAERRANPAAPECSRRLHEDASWASATPRMVRYRRRPLAAPLGGGFAFRGEPISHPPHRMDVPRPPGVGLEVPPQAHDEVVDGARGGTVLVAPHALEDELARDHLPLTLDQELHQHALLLGQLDLAARSLGLEGAEVDLVVAELEDPALGNRRLVPLLPPQDAADAQHHLFEQEWLGHVVVAAVPQAGETVGVGAARGQEEDRHPVAGFAQPLADVEPRDAGEHYVEHHEVEVLGGETLEPGLPVADDRGLIPLELEVVRQRLGKMPLILDDQNATCHRSPRSVPITVLGKFFLG